ncbi:nicastrin [Melitaea cinxia]|uniref:nicastrin n=1 Tax=Melitaea cinxia TaxID=113334 RepID=UPI001E26F897|nr:nicastrin [Melitaea cinxia]
MDFQNINYLVLLTVVINVITCERLHEQIYSPIEGGAACFRRLNGTHQTGCSSSLSGTVGIVEMIQNVSDAQWLVHNSSAGPYMAVVSTWLFYDIIEILMHHPENVAGVLLYDNVTMRPDAFSQESRCPNEYASWSKSQCSSTETPSGTGLVWNEKGTDLLRRDIPFPIFFLPQTRITEISKIEQCYNRYNIDKDNQKGRALCSLQLSSFMYAAVNSMVCLRRSASSAILTPTKVCDPLGDYNVYYSLFPRAKEAESKKKPVTLVTARIDSASLFDGVAPGAASSVVGKVSHIVAAATLSQIIPITDVNLYDENVLWTLFNGESFDYIGSQRVAYDIARGAWPPISPLSPKDISLHIELGQLGGSLKLFKENTSWPLYAFAPYENVLPDQATAFLVQMENNLSAKNMTVTPIFTTNIPPSSLHSFQRIFSNVTENDLPELLLADFRDTFSNKFYQSALDDYENIGFTYHNISIGSDGKFLSTDELLANGTMKESEAQVKIARVATALAYTLYQRVTGKPYTGTVSASAHLVDEMLYCFLQSQACRLLAAADYGSSEETPAERPVPLYVGVATWASTPAVYAGHLLALLTGTHRAVNRTACDQLHEPGFSYYWLKGWNHSGICIQTTMNFSQAISPAFVKADYDMTSGEFSTWTESVWQAMWARVFVSAGGGGARLAAVAGVLATSAAALLTFWLQRHATLIFLDAPASLHSDASGIIRTVNC